MRHWSLSVIFTYFVVFVFHPAFVLTLAVSLSPGRAMAAQANAIYDSLNSKYKVNTPDNDVAKEDRLSEIQQKYGKGVGGSADVIKSLEKYQGQSHVGNNVNLTGYFITSQRFGREMIKAGQGRLVHISTVASHSPETFSGVYSSTKAGVNMMSKMLAAEWGPYGVRSNCVEPCFVKTPMSANFYADPEVEKSRSRLIATRRIGEVSDIANAVMFLASTRSDFTTGDAIKVDGGFSNMMGDLTAKPGGRRAYADNYLKNKGVELWSDESGVAKPTDQ